MVLISACAGVGGTNNSITGSITSIDRVNHSVRVNANGQSITIKGLSDQELNALQSQVGKTYTISATQESDGSYQINSGTNPQPDENTPEGNSTPEANQTPDVNETPNSNEPQGVNEPGTISFIGKVQNVGNGSIVVSMPNGSNLSLSTSGADLSDFNGAQPGIGQLIKVEANANTNDGSFTATKLKLSDSSDVQDQNTVDFQGVTTSAVGSDRMIHFKVGSKSFSFPIASTADLSDFNGNAQSIQNNATVKVKVLFSGNNGSVTKVGSSND
jgi:hypothetical protein